MLFARIPFTMITLQYTQMLATPTLAVPIVDEKRELRRPPIIFVLIGEATVMELLEFMLL